MFIFLSLFRTSATYNDVVRTTVTLTAPEGKTCTVEMSVKSCTLQAQGTIHYYATGWIWFNYNDETQGHYKCKFCFSISWIRSHMFPLQGPLIWKASSLTQMTAPVPWTFRVPSRLTLMFLIMAIVPKYRLVFEERFGELQIFMIRIPHSNAQCNECLQ